MTQQINLYNPAFLKRNPAFEPAAWLGYAVAAVLVVMLGAAAWAHQGRQALENQAAAIDAGLKAGQAKSAGLAAQKAARKKSPELDAELARLENLVRARTDGLALMRGGAIGSTSGFSGHMHALARQSVHGLWLTGFSIAGGGSEVALRGRMLDADLLPRFLARLGGENVFTGRAFKTLNIEQPKAADAAPPVTPMPAFLAFEIATGGIASAAPVRNIAAGGAQTITPAPQGVAANSAAGAAK